MPIQCTVCLTNNPDGTSHCVACGSPLEVQSPATQYTVAPKTPPTSAGYHLLPGTLLQQGRYRIEKLLGEGGFGITYQGIYLANSAPVAIKELWPEKAARQGNRILWPNSIAPVQKQQQKDKFKLEANNQRQCLHPNIARIYDCFDENDTVYIVMEFIAGKSLYKVFSREGKLAEERAKNYFLQIAEALRVVHQNNFLHRDIKPDNIIITPEEKAILIDFGAAREFIAGRTGAMTQFLTPGYAPLEQYSYQSKRYPATDVYALCASLYELLTGQLPVAATERAIARQNKTADPLVPPRQICPRISPTIEKVILTGLKMNVEERFQSIEDLIDALNGLFISPLHRQAKNLARSGKLAEAIAAYDKCLAGEPDNGTATLEKAFLLLHADDPLGESVTQQALILNPGNGIAHGILGLYYGRRENWAEAFRSLQQAASLAPDTLWIQMNLALAAGRSGRWPDASASVTRSLDLAPDYNLALGLQAWIAYGQQQWKVVIRAANRAIFRSREMPGPHSDRLQIWLYPYLISALEKQGSRDLDRRVEEFSARYPESAVAWGWKGWLAAGAGAWNDAFVYFQRACQQESAPAWVWLNLGIAGERVNQPAEAIRAYEAYTRLFSARAPIEFRLGTLLAHSNQWIPAKNHLQTAIRLQPDYAEAHHNLGWVLLNIRTPDGQIAHPRELLSTYREALDLYTQQNRTDRARAIGEAFQDAGLTL